MALPGRTTRAAVRSIIEADDVPDATVDIDRFIDGANELVTEVCAGVLKADGVTLYYDNYRLELIECWLAAHLYTNFAPRATRERVGRLLQENQSKVDLGFDTSHYGQTAMRFDTNGGLAALNAKMKSTASGSTGAMITRKGGVRWLGESYCPTVPTDC